MVHRPHDLVAEVFHRVVGLPNGKVVTTVLVDEGVGEIHGERSKVEITLYLETEIIQREVGTVEDIIRSIHHPVYQVVASMVEGLTQEMTIGR